MTIVEPYPGLVTPTQRSPVADGSSWPSTRYDPGASGHNPGTDAPRSQPTTEWTASPVDYVFGDTGPVVADGTVYAGRPVRALAVDDGEQQWVHDGPRRTGRLAVADDAVLFRTSDDLRAVDASTGAVRWTVSLPGSDFGVTVAEDRAYVSAATDGDSSGRVHAIDVTSGDVDWSAETGGTLTGPSPVAGGVVVTGGDPLRALDTADGSVRWTFSRSETVEAATIAYDTVFALDGDRLTALDLDEGRPRWFVPGPFEVTRPAVGNGAVYVQLARSYQLPAVEVTTGATRWQHGDVHGILGPPSVTSETLLVFNEDGTLYAIDTAGGDQLWTREFTGNVPGTVAVADGVCYVDESLGPLHALTADG